MITLPTNPEARWYFGLLLVEFAAMLTAILLAIWAVRRSDRDERARRLAERELGRAERELAQVKSLDCHFFTTPAATPPQPAALRDRIRAHPPVRLSEPPRDTALDMATLRLRTLNGYGYAGSDIP